MPEVIVSWTLIDHMEAFIIGLAKVRMTFFQLCTVWYGKCGASFLCVLFICKVRDETFHITKELGSRTIVLFKPSHLRTICSNTIIIFKTHANLRTALKPEITDVASSCWQL